MPKPKRVPPKNLVLSAPRKPSKPLSYRVRVRAGFTFSDNGPVPAWWKRWLLRLVGWKVDRLRDGE